MNIENLENIPRRALLNIFLFAIGMGLVISIYTMTLSLSSLIAGVYSDADWALTLPVAFIVIGSFVASIPTAACIASIGRKPTFLLAALVCILGALIIGLGMWWNVWFVIILGFFVVGMGSSSGEFYIFAANDGVPKKFAGRVSGAILLGGLVAAVIGPNTGRVVQGIEILQTTFLAVPIVIACFAALQLLVLCFVKTAPRSQAQAQPRLTFQKLARLSRFPIFWSAALVTSCGFGAMTLLMNATTPWMFDHGMMLDHSTMVISLHIIGMFAPAPISGWITDRFGTVAAAVSGFGLIVVCMVILLYDQEFIHFLVALILLGLGWSLTQVSGTKRVMILSSIENKAEFEGGNVLLIAFAKIIASASAGALYFSGGSLGVLLASVLFVIIGAVGVLLLPVLCQSKQRCAD